MTIHRFALGKRATSITTIAVLGVVAVLIASATPARAADGRPTPVLAQGAGMGVYPSTQVRVVQRALHRRGYDLGAPGVDGRFGPLTGAAVRQMQADHGLTIDGVVGPQTRHALRLSRVAARNSHRRSEMDHRAYTVVQLRAKDHQHPADRSVGRSSRTQTVSTHLAAFTNSWLRLMASAAIGALTVLLTMGIIGLGRRRRRRHASSAREEPASASASAPRHHARPRARLATVLAHLDSTAPTSAVAMPEGWRSSRLPAGSAVLGYLTVCAEPVAQRADAAVGAIAAVCERSRWKLLEIIHDRENGRSLERPGLSYALERIADEAACGLIVNELHQVSTSVAELGALMAWFDDAGATLIALDVGIDTSTAEGRAVAATIIALGRAARERTGGRSSNGQWQGSRSTGRPAVTDRPDLVERIAAMRANNMTLRAIADQLNAEGVPTLRGGAKWRPSSIQTALGYRRPGPLDHVSPLGKRARP